MFVPVFVVMMGFRRSVRMGSGVHAKKNLPHQLLKDKGRLQNVKCGLSCRRRQPEGRASCNRRLMEGHASACPRRAEARPSAALGMTGAIERAIMQRDGCGSAQIATNRLRRAHGSLDPHSICDR